MGYNNWGEWDDDIQYLVAEGEIFSVPTLNGPFVSERQAESWADANIFDNDPYQIITVRTQPRWLERDPDHDVVLDVDEKAKVFFAQCSVCGRLPYTCTADRDNVPDNWNELRAQYVADVRNHQHSDPNGVAT